MVEKTHPLFSVLALFDNTDHIYLPTIFGVVSILKRTVDDKTYIEINRGSLYCEVEVTPKDYVILYGSDEAENLVVATISSANKNIS